jgi:hypothetical protein
MHAWLPSASVLINREWPDVADGELPSAVNPDKLIVVVPRPHDLVTRSSGREHGSIAVADGNVVVNANLKIVYPMLGSPKAGEFVVSPVAVDEFAKANLALKPTVHAVKNAVGRKRVKEALDVAGIDGNVVSCK